MTIEIFAKFVKKYSRDLKTIKQGGYIGKIGENSIGKTPFNIIWNSKEKGLVEELIMENNYPHIIYILKKYPAYKATLEQERKNIIKYLLAKEIKEWKRDNFKIGDKKCRVEVYDIVVD